MEHVLTQEELLEFSDHVPEIPWLGYVHTPSQIGDFDDYALQRGWSPEELHELKKGRFGIVDQNGLKPFLQSWFSIGLCEMVLGKGVDKEAFITIRGSKQMYTSASLAHIIRDLLTEFLKLPRSDQGKAQMLERFVRVLASASLCYHMFDDAQLYQGAVRTFYDDTYREIMRLFALTGTALQYAAHYLSASADGNFQPRLQNKWNHTFANQEALEGRLVRRGWCPFIRTILRPFHTIVAEYAAIVGPPATRSAHGSCSPRGCVRHNIDESTYETAHVKPECRCQFVIPSLSKIAEILENGGIPLMDLNKVLDTEGACSVAVVPFEEGKRPFTAVSHVWSGGLGSTSEQGLPGCAIDFLGGHMEADGESKLIWIDSLCIPSEKRLRKLSIHAINRVYSKASRTLVLDPELMKSNSATAQRMLLWMATAAWMQRMVSLNIANVSCGSDSIFVSLVGYNADARLVARQWTLPEGRLSRLPFIAFKDGVVPLRRLLQDENSAECSSVAGALRPELHGLFSIEYNTLRYIHGSLCFRTTSKREDEAPALAALFGIDTRRIRETMSLDERMAIFWIALRDKMSIPINILFLHGPKLAITGLRWAPRSLLNAGSQLSLLWPGEDGTSYDVDLGEDGALTATYVVIHLGQRTRVLRDKFNPIRLAFVPDPGSDQIRTAMFTIQASGRADLDAEDGALDDIDAFAVNVTNLEARTGASLASELVSSSKTVVALTTSDSGRSSHSFIARHWMQLSPLETKGIDLGTGYVGWARISIS